MARIRTIKPEFPQSESMGRVSREARLCFIQLWTLADDSGRLRGNSRMLASLLYPYDDDASGLIDTWLSELVTEDCILRYQADGQNYIEICNWLSHQKIDKPSPSKIPAPLESSRIFANPLESSALDQGRDQGKEGIKERNRTGSEASPSPVSKKFNKPSLEEVRAYCKERGNTINPQSFIDFYVSNGWKVGKNAMKDWRAAVRTWEQRDDGKQKPARKLTWEEVAAMSEGRTL